MSDHKLVPFEGKNYRVGRFTAKVGSYILAQLLPKLMPFLRDNFDITAVAAILPTLDEATFGAIQDHAMAVVSKVQENGAVTPLFVKPNRWTDKEMEFDSPAVMTLTIHAVTFNLAPFFTGGGLQKLLASVLDSNL